MTIGVTNNIRRSCRTLHSLQIYLALKTSYCSSQESISNNQPQLLHKIITCYLLWLVIVRKREHYISEIFHWRQDRGIQLNYFTYPELLIMHIDEIHIIGRNLFCNSSKKHRKRHPRGSRSFMRASNSSYALSNPTTPKLVRHLSLQ